MSVAFERSSDQAEWMQRPVGGGTWARRIVLGIVFVLTAFFIVAPVMLILTYAFASGIDTFLNNLIEPTTLHAILLTLLTALLVVPVNIMFGIAAAWTVTKFDFRGKTILISLIELPYSISPIVAGVACLFVYGAQGLFGAWLDAHNIKIVFALPAIFLASTFVTAPFVARELIPLMQVQGTDEEEAAVTLGASGFTTFWRVTLPNIKWAIVYGAILTNARVMGEFGAVSVVSGNIRGQTTTLPLQIELLYQDYNSAGAFAAATVLTAVAGVTIIIKVVLERFGSASADTRH
jgi:sulfate/thiosulfate transport system permease protein